MRCFLWDIPVDNITLEKAAENIHLATKDGIFYQVVTLNLEILSLALIDDNLAKVIKEASLVVSDGRWVAFLVRLFKGIRMKAIPGIELTEEILSHYPDTKVYLLGSKPSIVEKAYLSLSQEYGVNIVGFHDGYFENDENIIKDIKDNDSSLLIVGMGTPKQEIWIYTNKKELNLPTIGVGGSIDVWSGESHRAPFFFTSLGLEWLYRTTKEPRRLRRLLLTIIRLITVFIKRGLP